jgi:hypothetical protein
MEDQPGLLDLSDLKLEDLKIIQNPKIETAFTRSPTRRCEADFIEAEKFLGRSFSCEDDILSNVHLSLGFIFPVQQIIAAESLAAI